MQRRCVPLLVAAWLAAGSALAADLVVVGHPSAAPMTREQVADLYLGKTQGQNPIDLPQADPLHAEFYRKATGRDMAQVKATWARLVFGGKAQPPRQAADAAAVRKAVAADPKAVGYLEKSAVDASVRVILTLD